MQLPLINRDRKGVITPPGESKTGRFLTVAARMAYILSIALRIRTRMTAPPPILDLYGPDPSPVRRFGLAAVACWVLFAYYVLVLLVSVASEMPYLRDIYYGFARLDSIQGQAMGIILASAHITGILLLVLANLTKHSPCQPQRRSGGMRWVLLSCVILSWTPLTWNILTSLSSSFSSAMSQYHKLIFSIMQFALVAFYFVAFLYCLQLAACFQSRALRLAGWLLLFPQLLLSMNGFIFLIVLVMSDYNSSWSLSPGLFGDILGYAVKAINYLTQLGLIVLLAKSAIYLRSPSARLSARG